MSIRQQILGLSLCVMCLGGGAPEASAAPVSLDFGVSGVEIQQLSAWPRIRDAILGREREVETPTYDYAPPPPRPPRPISPPPPRGWHDRHHHDHHHHHHFR